MSRLIVKGLPKYLTEEKLKSHFSKQGNVTDVKLMKKRNGESRRFAFVGYKSRDDAEQAVDFFDQSFIDTAKIEVQLAKSFADPDVPISMKEQRRMDNERIAQQEERLLKQDQERQLKKQKVIKSKIDEEIESNPKLKEFMETFKPSSQSKSWASDSLADGSGAPSSKDLENALAEKDGPVPQIPKNDSDDEYEDFDKKPDDDEDEVMIPFNEPNENSQDDEQSNAKARDDKISDLEWLQLKRKRMIENEDRIREIEEQQRQQMKRKAHAPTRIQSEEPEVDPIEVIINKIKETGRLFIRNILYTSTEEEFQELFSKYGKLEEVHIAVDTRTGKSKGFVYIQFSDAEDAVKAFEALDKQIFQGRLLHILPGEKKKDHRLDEFDLKNLPLKKQRELKRKDQASRAQFSWNSLYMNQDAVMESVAAKLGVSKAQLINPQNSDSAVKQALAEASVIGDVRKYFEDKGVDLTSFDKRERDDKIILVKNFSFGTTIGELNEMFGQFGEIKRLLMPPAGTIAIVEFRDLPSARSAFTKLAFKRFKKTILYLEKGPKDLFTREPSSEDTVEVVNKPDAVEAKVTANDILSNEPQADVEESMEVDGPTVSVFVKNLNFSTTTEQLNNLFKTLPGFAVALVKTKPDPKKEGSTLSMGFGFVEFRSKEDADKAIAVMDGHVLDGHKLQLKLSNRTSGSTSKKAKSTNKSSKIIIKNLPFEATRKDIIELFGSFGKVKSARVPKKFNKSARGFAFVEFSLLKEAENAMNQLEGVHLLGRRLVMDYAEHDAEDAEAEIERMTKKVKQQFETQQVAAQRLAGKSKKLDLEDEEA